MSAPRVSVDELLAAARAGLDRVDPARAAAALDSGAVLIDIRSDSQIAADGVVPGALVIARNVLEWRLDPGGDFRHPDAPGLDAHVIVMCNEGYASSLAAATLQQMGFDARDGPRRGLSGLARGGSPGRGCSLARLRRAATSAAAAACVECRLRRVPPASTAPDRGHGDHKVPRGRADRTGREFVVV